MQGSHITLTQTQTRFTFLYFLLEWHSAFMAYCHIEQLGFSSTKGSENIPKGKKANCHLWQFLVQGKYLHLLLHSTETSKYGFYGIIDLR